MRRYAKEENENKKNNKKELKKKKGKVLKETKVLSEDEKSNEAISETPEDISLEDIKDPEDNHASEISEDEINDSKLEYPDEENIIAQKEDSEISEAEDSSLNEEKVPDEEESTLVSDKKNEKKLKENNKEEKEKAISRRIFDMVPVKDEDDSRKRGRGQKSTGKRKGRKQKKLNAWMSKSLFVMGNTRFTRFAGVITILVVLFITSGSIVLAASDAIFGEVMPINNEELIEALKTVYIIDGDLLSVYQTMGESVSKVLIANDITLGDDDTVSPSLSTQAFNRMLINIQRAIYVDIITFEDEQTVVMYSGTVEDALSEAGLEYDDDDEIEPSLDTELEDDMQITLDYVEVVTVTEEVVIEYDTEYVDEPTILNGYWNIAQEGEDGLAEVTYEITYVNGEEQVRKAIEENMLEDPVNEVMLIGTGLTRLDADEESDDEEVSTSVENPDEQETNPTVPGTTSTYVDTVSCMVTAYTHTGSTTATGTWPRSTRTLENPGSCAVVPATFPYGSLLYVTGYGYCIAEDTGAFRNDPDRWNQVDVFMNTYAECITWGRQYSVTVYVIRYGY